MHLEATKNLFDLSGKTAMVTGGSRGLGAAMAAGLASAGAEVFSVSRSSASGTQATGICPIEADVSMQAGREAAVKQVLQRGGKIDIFVHAAGQQHRDAAEHFSMSKWHDILDLHVAAAMDLSQRVAAGMLARSSGKIIFVSSVLAFQGGLMIPAYAAAKHAVTGLTKALANEWASRGINVNAVAPGYFNTGVAEGVLNDPTRGPQILSRIPAGRPGSPEQLAGPIVFLASKAAGYVHGHTLVVDGGWLGR